MGRRLSGCFRTGFQDIVYRGDVLLVLFSSGADGLQLFLDDLVEEFLDLHVAQAASLVMGLQLVQSRVLRQIPLKMLRLAESVQVSEHRISLQMAGILDPKMQRIGVHAHDLFLYFLGIVRQIDTVAQGFAHLGLTVGSRQTQAGSVIRQKHLRLHQHIVVDGVEFAHNLLGLLQHGQLILTHRNGGCLESGDVRRLADGIAEESHRDAGLEVPQLDLRLHRGVSLQSGEGHQIHIVESQLRQLRNLRLNKQIGFCRIQTHGQVIQRHLNDVLPYLLRVFKIIRQRLRVGDHDKYFLIFS